MGNQIAYSPLFLLPELEGPLVEGATETEGENKRDKDPTLND